MALMVQTSIAASLPPASAAPPPGPKAQQDLKAAADVQGVSLPQLLFGDCVQVGRAAAHAGSVGGARWQWKKKEKGCAGSESTAYMKIW